MNEHSKAYDDFILPERGLHGLRHFALGFFALERLTLVVELLPRPTPISNLI